MSTSVPHRRLRVLMQHVPPTTVDHQSGHSRVVSSVLVAGTEQQEIMGRRGSYLTYFVRGQDANHPIMEITKLVAKEQGMVNELGDAAFAVAHEKRMMVLPSCSEMRRYVAEHEARLSCTTLCEFDGRTPGLEISVRMDGLATLRLTDARRRNPLCSHILFRMREFLRTCMVSQLESDASKTSESFPSPAVRAILLASTGPVFSSGHDFRDFFEVSQEQQAEVLQACSDVNMLLGRVPQVTVASVDGLASAGGCQLVASCDLVYASASSSRFCLPGSKNGHGFCHTPAVSVAHRATSVRKAFELAMMAEEIGPDEAEKLGLCNHVVPGGSEELEQAVEAVVTRLCKTFSKNTATGKETFYRQLQAPSLESKYEMTMPVMLDMFNTPTYAEVMRAFVQRRSKKQK